jgi:transposase-like protein
MSVQKADKRVRPAMNLGRLIEQFGTDDRARDYLMNLRWPDGVRCPRCGFQKVSRIGWTDKPDGKKGRRQFDCNSCRYRFSVTTGTVFHDSHLPLWKWFAATYLMCESRKGISANQLMRMLGIGSFTTAWYLCNRIRSAMDEVSPEMLTGVVEVDETYIGGKLRTGTPRANKLANKVMVLGALERGGEVRLRVEERGVMATKLVVTAFLTDEVSGDAEAIYTDQGTWYRSLGDENTRHESVDHAKEEWVRGDVTTNGIESAWSLLKRSIVGSYHQLSAKHLQAYADEFAFRFNNRENPFLFRDTLLKLIEGDSLPYAQLIAPTH